MTRSIAFALTAAFTASVMPTSVSAAGSSPVASTNLTGTTYSENFDSLSNTGANNTSLPAGFQIVETDNGSRADGRYAAGNGTSNSGNVYSFGDSGSRERALGSLGSGSNEDIIFGAVFNNLIGQTISAFDITYTGEQWRAGNSPNDGLTFQYSTDATSMTSGTWNTFSALNFAPLVLAGDTAINGNVNSAILSGTISGLSIGTGATFAIRWLDGNSRGTDHGLAVDNLSLTATLSQSAVPEPATWAMMLLGMFGIGATVRRGRASNASLRMA